MDDGNRISEIIVMISDKRTPKTKQDLIRSIQSIPRIEFDVIEVGSMRDKRSVTKSLDRWVSKGPISVVIIQQK